MKTRPISRRTLAAGLALAPVAGLPALAGAAFADDPVLAALEKLKELKLAAVEPSDAHTVAEEVYFAARKGIFVDGKALRTHDQIDSHFSSGSCPLAWCSKLGLITIFAGVGRVVQVATVGNPTIGVSLNGVIVSRVI